MKKLLSCAFNMDSGCVVMKFSDGGMISINCTAVAPKEHSRFCKNH